MSLRLISDSSCRAVLLALRFMPLRTDGSTQSAGPSLEGPPGCEGSANILYPASCIPLFLHPASYASFYSLHLHPASYASLYPCICILCRSVACILQPAVCWLVACGLYMQPTGMLECGTRTGIPPSTYRAGFGVPRARPHASQQHPRNLQILSLIHI